LKYEKVSFHAEPTACFSMYSKLTVYTLTELSPHPASMLSTTNVIYTDATVSYVYDFLPEGLAKK
jgi:hypothetical protein